METGVVSGNGPDRDPDGQGICPALGAKRKPRPHRDRGRAVHGRLAGENMGYENTLMVHMRRLREKIEPDPSHPRYLVTVRGLGYRLLKEDGR